MIRAIIAEEWRILNVPMRWQDFTEDTRTSATSTTSYSSRISWPDAVAYQEAIQTPRVTLTDPALRLADVRTDRLGLPIAYAGRFAVVFKLGMPNGEQWALRCFTTPGDESSLTNRGARYKLIQKYVDENRAIFVPFRYVERGIKVGTSLFPVIVMRWAGGTPLGRWVESNRNNPTALRNLSDTLTNLLAYMEEKGIAHGDWQHDNLLVTDEGKRVTFVDYDGMYVPELEGQPSPEIGHPNYQHPGRTSEHFGPGLDRFACLVVQTSLLAIAHDPGLWEKYSDGESLLFKRADFTDPEISPVFFALRNVAEDNNDMVLADAIARLEDACHAGAMSTLLPALPGQGLNTRLEAPIYAPLPQTLPIPEGFEETVSNLPPVTGRAWMNPATNTAGTTQSQQTNPGPGSSTWWTLPETVTRRSATPLSSTTTPRSRVRNVTVAQADPFTYLERLNSAETTKAEERHFTTWRISAVLLFAALAFLIFLAFASSGGFIGVIFPLVFNLAGLGYTKWPRKVIHDELTEQISKMEKLIGERQRKIAEKQSEVGLVTTTGPITTASEYIAEKLRQTSINRVLTVNGIHISTLRQLREENIENALDLQRRQNFAKVPPHQVAALQNWCRELEAEAAAEWRKNANARTSGPNPSAEISRLQHEIAEFERHTLHLKRERDQYPDVSWGTYLRRLAFMEENKPTGTPANGTGTTP